MNISIIKKAEAFVSLLFEREASEMLAFHNLKHTRTVVRAVKEIAAATRISAQEQEILILAAWFHDCGYLLEYFDHEEKGKKTAEAFLIKENYPAELLNKVLACIEATKPIKMPETLLEKILCDADMRHLASEDYPCRLHALRKEWAVFLGQSYSDEQWIRLNRDFLSGHRYFTSYGQEILEAAKGENMRRLDQMIIRTGTDC